MTLTTVSSQNKIKWTSWDSVSEKLENKNRKFIIYFYYDGCKWCRYMEETTLASDNIAKFINQKFYAFRINALSSDKIVIVMNKWTIFFGDTIKDFTFKNLKR